MPGFRPWLTPAPPWVRILLRGLKTAALILLGISGALLVLYLVHHCVLPLFVWVFPSLEKPFLDFAVYGAYPTREYVSFNLSGPRPWQTLWDESCDGGHIFVGPNGKSVRQTGPEILTTDGELVWKRDDWGDIMNFNMQTYRGKNYLTFWAGAKAGASGKGDMFMLDENYNVAYQVKAVGEGNKGDLHEFRVTKDGTALVTVFNNTQFDIRSLGNARSANGWITDGLFQEIDIETNELLFEWRASSHFPHAEDTYYFDPFGGYFESHPFDYYHLNSIEKDSKGNYLISSRHWHTITYIEGKTGKTLWVLGGKLNDFTDLSDGLATGHQWQHNARWVDEEKGIISFYDNGVAGPLHVDAPYSKGTMLQLDLENMTATHLRSYISNDKLKSASQGNLYRFDTPGNDTHVILGWGAIGAYSEFHEDGTLLCEVHYSADWLWWFERWKSYRVYRLWGWVGKPLYPPSAKIKGNRLYVSWNGATEVKYWELQASHNSEESDDSFDKIETIEKDHFEDSFVLPKNAGYKQYRVAAVDSQGRYLNHTNHMECAGGWSVFGVILVLGAGFGASAGFWYLYRAWLRRRREGRKMFIWEPTELFNRGAYQYRKL